MSCLTSSGDFVRRRGGVQVSRWWSWGKAALAGGALVVGLGAGPATLAASRSGHPHAAHTRLATRLRWVTRLKAALTGRGVEVLGMRAAAHAHARGYVVSYLKGH